MQNQPHSLLALQSFQKKGSFAFLQHCENSSVVTVKPPHCQGRLGLEPQPLCSAQSSPEQSLCRAQECSRTRTTKLPGKDLASFFSLGLSMSHLFSLVLADSKKITAVASRYPGEKPGIASIPPPPQARDLVPAGDVSACAMVMPPQSVI